MKLILVGPPGAGKGTLAGIICKSLDLPTISTGNILREAIKNQTQLGKDAKQYMDKGQLLPDEVVVGMIKDRVAQDDCKNGFILDGFPRTIKQAEVLDEICDVDAALSLEARDEVIIERMTGRRSCLACGATYHTKNNRSKVETLCDNCGSQLVIRADDEPNVVIDRLATYHEKTKPLKDYYNSQGKLLVVNAENSIETMVKNALSVLGR